MSLIKIINSFRYVDVYIIYVCLMCVHKCACVCVHICALMSICVYTCEQVCAVLYVTVPASLHVCICVNVYWVCVYCMYLLFTCVYVFVWDCRHMCVYTVIIYAYLHGSVFMYVFFKILMNEEISHLPNMGINSGFVIYLLTCAQNFVVVPTHEYYLTEGWPENVS